MPGSLRHSSGPVSEDPAVARDRHCRQSLHPAAVAAGRARLKRGASGENGCREADDRTDPGGRGA